MNLGTAILLLRKKKNISQKELAIACGISQAALSQIEKNKTSPAKQTLDRISQFLAVPKSMLIALGLSADDVPAERQEVYEQLFPIVQKLILQIACGEEESE